MPLDGFSDLEEESLTTVTAELLSEAISTVDNTTNISYYLFNTDSKAKWSVISPARLQKKSIKLDILSNYFFLMSTCKTFNHRWV